MNQEPILRYFEYQHLPPHLQDVSRHFHSLAHNLLTLPRNPERTVALRKLLEAKDAAVRASLPPVPEHNERIGDSEPKSPTETVRYWDVEKMDYVEREIIKADIDVDGPPEFR